VTAKTKSDNDRLLETARDVLKRVVHGGAGPGAKALRRLSSVVESIDRADREAEEREVLFNYLDSIFDKSGLINKWLDEIASKTWDGMLKEAREAE